MKIFLAGTALAAMVMFSGCAGDARSGQGTGKATEVEKLLQQKDSDLVAHPFTNTRAGLLERRARLENDLLQEFERCPECFVRKISGAQRTYLFDAVTDCETAIRVGSMFDGGKWLCAPQSLPGRPVVYSFGVGGDLSFDADMAGLFGCDVFMFDPSPSVVRNLDHFRQGRSCGRGHLFFEPVGLGPVSAGGAAKSKLVIEGKECPVRTLAELALAHGHKQVDILKIDIEGGEFAALDQILSSNTLQSLKVNQLLVEFHLINDDCFASFMRTMGRLKKQHYALFRKEFNPYAAATCAEYAFVRR